MEIIPKVHLVPGLRGANAYLLVGESLTLVDAGMSGSADTILGYVEGLGMDAAALERMIITHHHMDHVGGAAEIVRRTSARILTHPDDAPYISGEQPPPPASSASMRLLLGLVERFMPQGEPVVVDTTVQESEHLDILGGATVVHVPGHTPGSVALHFPGESLLICGDVIDHRRDRLGPPPRAFSVDPEQAVDSIRRLAELDFEVLCPGHGAPIASGAGDALRAMVGEL